MLSIALSVRSAFAFRTLSESGFLRSVASIVSAGVVGQAILLAILPIATRLYTPQDFGTAAVFGALLSTLLMVASLRYEMAIVLPRSDRQAEVLVRLALLLACGTAVLVLVVVAIWRTPIGAALHVPALVPILWILPIAVVGAGTYRAFNFWAIRRKAFGLVARTRIYQALANALIQLGIGAIYPGAIGLIAGQVSGLAVGGNTLGRGVRVRTRFTRAEWVRMSAALHRYRRFPLFDVPAALVDTLNVQLPNLTLALLFSSDVAGWYMLADRVIVTPLALIGQAIGQVVYANSRDQIAEDKLFVSVARTVVILGGGVLAAGIVFVPLAPVLVQWVFGSQWRVAGIYSAVLFFGFAAQFVYSSISLALPATNGQHINLLIHGALLASKALALCVGFMRGSDLAAIVGIALVTFFGNVVAICVTLAHVRSYQGRNGSRTTMTERD